MLVADAVYCIGFTENFPLENQSSYLKNSVIIFVKPKLIFVFPFFFRVTTSGSSP